MLLGRVPRIQTAVVAAMLVSLPAAQVRAAGPAAGEAGVAARALYEAASTFYKSGSYEEALRGYEKAYALEPLPEALYGVARCLDQLGRADAAVAAYERFLAAATGHEGAAKARAYAVNLAAGEAHRRLGLGAAAEARARFEKALALHPDADPEVLAVGAAALHAGLGEALVALGDLEGARAHLRAALSPPPGPDVRARAEGLLARIDAPPASPHGALSAVDASRPVDPLPAPVSPLPPRARRGALPWLVAALGVAGAGIAIAVSVTLARALRPGPDTSLGTAVVDFRGGA